MCVLVSFVFLFFIADIKDIFQLVLNIVSVSFQIDIFGGSFGYIAVFFSQLNADVLIFPGDIFRRLR
jgi:hypothetical protein